MRGTKGQETGNLFATVEKGKTYTCYDKEAYCWNDLAKHDLTSKRVTVLMISGDYACVELVSDRRQNFDVRLDSLKK